MLPFVHIGLVVQERLEMTDAKGKAMVMKFAKIYTPEKMGKIVETAHSFDWWRNNPTAAFMKAVGLVNKDEREAKESSTGKEAGKAEISDQTS